MYYRFTRQELKEQNGIDFKQGDVININEVYEIEIDYGVYNTPSLCSKVWDLRKMRYQDVFFRPMYIEDFLHRKSA